MSDKHNYSNEDDMEALVRNYFLEQPWEVRSAIWDASVGDSAVPTRQSNQSAVDSVINSVSGWIERISEMLKQPQAALLGDEDDLAKCEVRVSRPPADSLAAKWLDRIELIRQSTKASVRYRAQAVLRPDNPDATKVLVVALLGPDGSRSELKLEGNSPKTFRDPPPGLWDELNLEIRVLDGS